MQTVDPESLLSFSVETIAALPPPQLQQSPARNSLERYGWAMRDCPSNCASRDFLENASEKNGQLLPENRDGDFGAYIGGDHDLKESWISLFNAVNPCNYKFSIHYGSS